MLLGPRYVSVISVKMQNLKNPDAFFGLLISKIIYSWQNYQTIGSSRKEQNLE